MLVTNVTAYESLVTLHPAHARHFLRTGDTSGPYGTKRGAMPPDEVEEYKDLMIDALEAVALRPRPDARTARFDVAPADAPKEPAEKAPPPRGKAKKRARGE